ncbi:MAG: hypothetical protein EHM42_09920 [Planctomycetaceae bacterium]|nr:MAG: hypothetical protein EHM42_09920 [Planctomycetaceae bacterium]
MTGQQPSRAESDVVTASLSESVNEPVKAEATVELPPEPVPAVVDAAGASGENNGSSDRDWGAVFRCLPLIVEPTMATRGNQYYESSR